MPTIALNGLKIVINIYKIIKNKKSRINKSLKKIAKPTYIYDNLYKKRNSKKVVNSVIIIIMSW